MESRLCVLYLWSRKSSFNQRHEELMLIKLNFCSCSSLVAATCVCSSTPWSISSLSVFLDVGITKIPRGNVHQDAIRCGLVDLASLGRRTA